MFGPDGLAQRIQAVVYGAVGSLPRTLRRWAAVICHATNMRRLTKAMAHWLRGGHLDKQQFGTLFLGRDADDPLVDLLHSALPGVGHATGHTELRDVAAKIAAAIQAVGPDRWPRFLAELEDRACDPATQAAIECQHSALDPQPPPAPVPDQPHHTPHSTDQTPRQETDPPAAQHAHLPRIAAGEPQHAALTGLPPPGTVPPVRNPARLRSKPGTQPSLAGSSAHSLWDDRGGEWQYHSGDAWHNPHWDYNEHSDPTTPWRSIPLSDRSPWIR